MIGLTHLNFPLYTTALRSNYAILHFQRKETEKCRGHSAYSSSQPLFLKNQSIKDVNGKIANYPFMATVLRHKKLGCFLRLQIYLSLFRVLLKNAV